MNPHQNAVRVRALLSQVREHPMCLELREDAASATIIFPAGDFPMHGITARYRGKKADTLERVLYRMERIWLESFPGHRA